MKKFITAVALVAGTIVGYGQECSTQTDPNYNGDEAGCRQGVSLYTEFLKQENYADAAKEWWAAQKVCPQYKPILYDNGVYIYRQLAKGIADKKSEAFTKTMDSLNTVYDLWVKNFGDCYEIQMQRAHDNMMDENKRYNKAYGYFKQAFATMPKEKIQSYDAVYYFRAAYFMLSGKLIECEEMMNLYEQLDAISNEKIQINKEGGNSGEVQNWITTQQTLESYITPCANCEQLLKIYKPQIEADWNNIELLKKVSDKLTRLNCEDPIMEKMGEVLHENNPTYETAFKLGNAKWTKGEYAKAKEYYDQAMSYPECTEDTKKAIWQRLGEHDLKKGNYKGAFGYGKQIGGCDGKYLQARAVASSASSCATTKTSRTAIYSYALDLADEAGSCVPDSWKSSIKGNLSTNTELFQEGLKPGDSYPDVPCWGVTVKLRAQ